MQRGREHKHWSGGMKSLGAVADKALLLNEADRAVMLSKLMDRITVTDGCWEWMGRLDDSGYAKTGTMRVSRLIYVLTYLEPLGELKALHTCDNPKCVNPLHLFAGTQTDNMKDMQEKGREHKARGSELPHTKLNPNKVRDIRRLRAEGVSVMSLARTYGVSVPSIRNIINGKNWRHVA